MLILLHSWLDVGFSATYDGFSIYILYFKTEIEVPLYVTKSSAAHNQAMKL